MQGGDTRGDRSTRLVAESRPVRRGEGGRGVSNEDFKAQVETLNEELEALNLQAHELEQTIASNVAEILEL